MASLTGMFVGTFLIVLCAGIILPAGWQLAQPTGRRWLVGAASPRRVAGQLLVMSLLPALLLLPFVFLAPRSVHVPSGEGPLAPLLFPLALIAPVFAVLLAPFWLSLCLAPPADPAPGPALGYFARVAASLSAIVFGAALLVFLLEPAWARREPAVRWLSRAPDLLPFVLFLATGAGLVFCLARSSLELVCFLSRRRIHPLPLPPPGQAADPAAGRDCSAYYAGLVGLGLCALALWLASIATRLWFPASAYLPPVYSHPLPGAFPTALSRPGMMTTYFERPPGVAIAAAAPGLLVLLLGLLIALRFRPVEPAARLFSLLCVLYGLAWVPAFPRWGGPIFFIGAFLAKTFFSPVLLQFCLVFPRQRETITGEAERWWPWLRTGLYLPFALLAPLWLWLQLHVGSMLARLIEATQGRDLASSEMPSLYAAALGGGTDLLLRPTVWVIGGYALVRTGWELTRGREPVGVRHAARAHAARAQLKWVAAGGAVAGTVSLFGSLLLFPLTLPHLGSAWGDAILGYSILALPLGTAVAVFWYDLWDVDRLIRGAMVYGSLTLLLSALFVSSLLGCSAVLQRGSVLPPLLAFLVTAAVTIPLRDWFQRAVDQMFGREVQEFRHAQAELARLLSICAGSAELARLLTETVPQRLRLTGAWLVPAPVAASRAEQELRAAGAASVLPLAVGGQPLGWYGLGTKWWGLPLSREERELMQALAAQAAIAMGLLAEQETRLREQEAAQEERGRLSREIHDTISQHLCEALYDLDLAERRASQSPAELSELLGQVRSTVRESMKELRTAITVLKLPPSRLPLEQALQEVLARFARVGEFKAHFLAPETSLPALPPPRREALVRIARDALNNVVLHASATRVELDVGLEDGRDGAGPGVRLRIEDDGAGFALMRDELGRYRPEGLMGGLGLESMQERARQEGGELEIESAPGKGTCIRVWLPAAGGEDETERAAGR